MARLPYMKEARPTISVCIANYNGEHLLEHCIDSVLHQDIDADVEIIVHDDASTDGSLDLLAVRYPEVRVIASLENIGFSVSCNRIAAVARGDHLLMLNNDAALLPDALQTLLEARKQIDSPCILSLPQRDWATGQLVDRGCLLDPFNNPVPNLDHARYDVAYVIGALLWIDRSMWDSLGGFPEWMESIGEDLYLCGVARLQGLPVRCIDRSGYRHRQGTSFGGNRANGEIRSTFRRRRLSECNKTRALCILTPGVAMVPLVAMHWISLAAEGVILCIIKDSAALWQQVYWPALKVPFGEFRRLCQLRGTVQATRRIDQAEWFSRTAWQFRKLAMLFRHGFPNVD